eukprot:CAMPEP_0180648784 /NCGR_PEP_ID=MMETSP1037_2-20121125/51180_1 /TAXON_ID=632150 /ORGANISM="Azadinium spinosum, Strain 3D9" /LENGTH=117 /DNA_ID=CAMNT_0022673677 /DNA_START=53 /DNA_END=403 /DNA_ORIENTATION=-
MGEAVSAGLGGTKAGPGDAAKLPDKHGEVGTLIGMPGGGAMLAGMPVRMPVTSAVATTGLWRKLRSWHEASPSPMAEPKSLGNDRERRTAPGAGVGGAGPAWMKVLCTMLPRKPSLR